MSIPRRLADIRGRGVSFGIHSKEELHRLVEGLLAREGA